jgi:hypothetical protein
MQQLAQASDVSTKPAKAGAVWTAAVSPVEELTANFRSLILRIGGRIANLFS